MYSATAFLAVFPLRSAGSLFAAATTFSDYSPLKRCRPPSLSPSPSSLPSPLRPGLISATLIPANAPLPTEETLSSFASAVTGEWYGYEGRFDPITGASLPIPDYYIPDQFNEWGAIPQGFESNHSIIVRDTRLFRKFFRILPSVSLFGDHVDLEEEFDILPIYVDSDSPNDTCIAIFTDGSLVSSPRTVPPKRESLLEKWPAIMLSVRDPRPSERRAANVWLTFDFEKTIFLNDIRAVVEKYSCNYCDGADIEGSSGFIDGWVSNHPGSPDSLHGRWEVASDADPNPSNSQKANSEQVITRELDQEEELENGQMAQASVIFLPGGLDVSLRREAEDGNEGVTLTVELGWLVEDGLRVVLRRRFGEEGTVKDTERVVERRLS